MKFKIALKSLRTSLQKHLDDAKQYAASLPVRGEVAALSTTSRLCDAAVAVAAKLHEATSSLRRQRWLKRVADLRKGACIKELSLTTARQPGCRVDVKDGVATVRDVGADVEAQIARLEQLLKQDPHKRATEIAEEVGLPVADILKHVRSESN